jgi:hypothetical protein
MDRDLVFMKHWPVLFSALALFCNTGCADANFEETELLQSWGLKPDAQGRLIFIATQTADDASQRWQPDMSVLQSHPVQNPPEPLIPLVIGSHDQNDSHE